MKQTSEIRAAGLVREIRDAQANASAKKSPAEVIEFFNRAGDRAKDDPRHSIGEKRFRSRPFIGCHVHRAA